MMERTFPKSFTAPAPLGYGFPGRLYQSLLYRALAPMQSGSMRVELPDGKVWNFGECDRRPLEADGPEPGRIQVHNSAFFKKCVLYGDIGFGESYVDGDWDTDDIAAVVSWFILNLETAPTLSGSRRQSWRVNWLSLANRWIHWLRSNSLKGTRRNIGAHYDLSNGLFALFLDRSMTYSCAYFRKPEMSLQAAQQEKYERLCRKLRISSSDHVLELGCGWGGFSRHAAETHGCRVTAITISRQQYEYARRQIDAAGLAKQVEVRLQDYRQVEGRFDKIVSIEMLEAVGHQFLELFFRKCHALLKRRGLLGLQVITCSDRRYDTLRKSVDWSQKHIFPGSLILSVAAVNRAVNRSGDLFLHDLEDMGPYYARTLSRWHQNFQGNLEAVRQLGFDERFIRKWNYYLKYCEAAFAMRHNSVIQAVYTRQNNFSL